MSENTVHYDDAHHRYSVIRDGAEAAFAEVDRIGADGLLIKHTEVAPAFEGQGIGGALVKHMLEDAKRQGRGVIPVCPYAAAWIKRHPEYLDHVRESYRAVLQR
jgi:predicted GNAT family acetyltransferase